MTCRVVDSFSSGGFFSTDAAGAAPSAGLAAADAGAAAGAWATAVPGSKLDQLNADRPQNVNTCSTDRFDMAVSSAGVAAPSAQSLHTARWAGRCHRIRRTRRLAETSYDR